MTERPLGSQTIVEIALRFTVAAAALWSFCACLGAEGGPPERLTDVFAPVVVGTPPVDAFNGLFLCTDGEIRHYGDDGFLFSRNHGLSWKYRSFPETQSSARTPHGGRPLGLNPKTGTCLRLLEGEDGMFIHRSTNGPDGPYVAWKIDEERLIMVRPPYFLSSSQRVLFAGHGGRPARITVFRSDDDGLTWAKTVLPPGPAFEITPPHKGPRWENWCVEPTILELQNGRLWMLARTSRDSHYECFSEDSGETWSPWQPSQFYGTLTMPTLYRLADGRVLVFWCNATPLPEVDRTNDAIPETAKTGRWEDVFTNRDVCHAAISEDDGQTWIGFREMRLNPWRNSSQLGNLAEHDFSVHQTQALQIPEGKVLAANGQDEKVRALIIFDPKWLYVPRRRSAFEDGLDSWSTHKFVKGIVGHCAYNRKPGPQLVSHPDKPDVKVLQIRHPTDPELVFDKDGAVWNFPAARKGSFITRIRLLPNGGGGQICLLDRWFNPTDPYVQDYSMFILTIPGNGRLTENVRLTPGRWHELRFEWVDVETSVCRLTVDNRSAAIQLPLHRPSQAGISYVHFQALSEESDLEGFLIESVDGGR